MWARSCFTWGLQIYESSAEGWATFQEKQNYSQEKRAASFVQKVLFYGKTRLDEIQL